MSEYSNSYSTNSQLVTPPPKTPEEEYFRLALLAQKIQYQQVDREFTFNIRTGKFYKLCLSKGVPFHQWYEWIQAQLKVIHSNHVAAVKALEDPKPKKSFFGKMKRLF